MSTIRRAITCVALCVMALVCLAQGASAQWDPCEIVVTGNSLVVARNGDVWDFTNAPGGTQQPAFNVFGSPAPNKVIVGFEWNLVGPFSVVDADGDSYSLNGQAVAGNVFDRLGIARGTLRHYSAFNAASWMCVTSTGAVYRNGVLQGSMGGGFTPTVGSSWGSIKLMHR